MLTSAALISTTAARESFVSTQWGAGAAACLGTSWEMTGRLALILTVSLDEIYYNIKIHQHESFLNFIKGFITTFENMNSGKIYNRYTARHVRLEQIKIL